MFQKQALLKSVPIVILSLALLGTSAIPSQADEVGDAIQQQQDNLNKQNQARGQLNQLTYTADKMKAQLSQLETQISAAQSLLSQKQSAYTQAQSQVETAQDELDQKQKEMEDRRQALGQRLKGIYESGQVSYLEMLFQSSDLGDFITRMEYFTKLVSNDRQLLTDIQTQKDQIAQKTQELQSRRDQAAQLQTQAASAKSDLDQKKSQQQVALDQNKKAQQDIFEEIDRLEAESNALADKIRQMQASRKGGVIGSISTWPLPGYYEISDPYGWRIHPITHRKSLHTGTDIPAPTGTAIHAAGAGVVLVAGWNTAYGNMVIIDHGGGVSTLYGHQSRLAVSEGQSVKDGQVIGYVGSTGWSTGAHLHFEVRVGGNPTDPLQYFHN